MATNLLLSTNDLVLLFNQQGLPTGNPTTDTIVDYFGPGGEILTLDTNLPPILQPGQRYYLGVANKIPTETNTFFLSVAFDQTDSYLVSVLELTNAIPYTTTIDVTNALDYFQYTVASNAVEVRFEITQMDGDVDLVVRKALPVQDPLPTSEAGRYDYLSRNPGTVPEQIVVTPTSDPVPLEAGRWYLGVINSDTNPVTYTVLVTETVGSLTNVIALTNGVPLDFTIPAGAGVTNYFLFSIAEATNSAVLFEAYNLTGNATLLAELGAFPDPLGCLRQRHGIARRGCPDCFPHQYRGAGESGGRLVLAGGSGTGRGPGFHHPCGGGHQRGAGEWSAFPIDGDAGSIAGHRFSADLECHPGRTIPDLTFRGFGDLGAAGHGRRRRQFALIPGSGAPAGSHALLSRGTSAVLAVARREHSRPPMKAR